MQVVQHELEGLRRERPGLTPRPTRDVATLKDFINNEKVRTNAGMQLCTSAGHIPSHCSAYISPSLSAAAHACVGQAALYAKVSTEDLHRLPAGKSHLRALHQVDWQSVDRPPHCSALYQIFAVCCS